MIINRIGAEFEYEGTNCMLLALPLWEHRKVSMRACMGQLRKSVDGEDKETENETPDLYCSFEVPVLPCEVKGGRSFLTYTTSRRPLTTSFWILSLWLRLWWNHLTI